MKERKKEKRKKETVRKKEKKWNTERKRKKETNFDSRMKLFDPNIRASCLNIKDLRECYLFFPEYGHLKNHRGGGCNPVRPSHWLLIPQRIQFKILVLTYIIHRRAPSYITELSHPNRLHVWTSHHQPDHTLHLVLAPTSVMALGARDFSVCAPPPPSLV